MTGKVATHSFSKNLGFGISFRYRNIANSSTRWAVVTCCFNTGITLLVCVIQTVICKIHLQLVSCVLTCNDYVCVVSAYTGFHVITMVVKDNFNVVNKRDPDFTTLTFWPPNIQGLIRGPRCLVSPAGKHLLMLN